MERRRPRLVLIHGGDSAAAGPVTRLGLRPPAPAGWLVWGAVVTKALLLVAVLAAIHAFRS